MSECGQGIFKVHGREMKFSKEELLSILEQHYDTEITVPATSVNALNIPTVGKWFEVNPQAINERLFQAKRNDERQEQTRKLILEALENVKNNPEKYGKKFKTLIPEKTWESKKIAELTELAYELGDHNADWVEQALEWAQRICNGESWRKVCNNFDTIYWCRIVIWKNGNARRIGGSYRHCFRYAPSYVGDYYFYSDSVSDYGVPLVVCYEK